MTPRKAANMVKGWLESHGFYGMKVSARTVSFCDLARADKVFVKVTGWKPNPAWAKLQGFAVLNGFLVEA